MDPSQRPKVAGDAFFLPDPEGIVYFRSNRGAFRMEGPMIDRWIGQLVPMFDGERSLAELTEGLPDAHRKRVCEIAATLLENGFARDVSRDRPHRLTNSLLEKYAAQIDFFDAFGGSGASRFEDYRRARVLAAGSGPMLVSLVSALLESGLPKFRVLIPGGMETDSRRIAELASYARLTDAEVEVKVQESVSGGPIDWEGLAASCDAALFVASGDNAPGFRELSEACKARKVPLFPAMIYAQTGVAGPIVREAADSCWESARQRLHRAAIERDPRDHEVSPTAEGMLANVLVFELFKMLGGVPVSELRNECYLLNLETLESSRHAILPHPRATGADRAEPKELTTGEWAETGFTLPADPTAPFIQFSRLTSPVSGIFHVWDEGNWKQLPLSLCGVQPADPRSEGPADRLPPILCGGYTHEEARREALLAGVEAYVSRWQEGRWQGGIGAGFTAAEGVLRAMRNFMRGRLGERIRASRPEGSAGVDFPEPGERTAFYLRSLTILQGQPEIAAGPKLYGFPVRWVRASGTWYGAVAWTEDLALQEALALAAMAAQTESEASGWTWNPAANPESLADIWNSVMGTLQGQGLRMSVFDLSTESFLKETLAGAFGIRLGKEEAP